MSSSTYLSTIPAIIIRLALQAKNWISVTSRYRLDYTTSYQCTMLAFENKYCARRISGPVHGEARSIQYHFRSRASRLVLGSYMSAIFHADFLRASRRKLLHGESFAWWRRKPPGNLWKRVTPLSSLHAKIFIFRDLYRELFQTVYSVRSIWFALSRFWNINFQMT